MIELNLNDLFSLTYNFDTLKRMIESLYNNQRLIASKVGMVDYRKDYRAKTNRSKEHSNNYSNLESELSNSFTKEQHIKGEKITLEEFERKTIDEPNRPLTDNYPTQPSHLLPQGSTLGTQPQQFADSSGYEKRIKSLENKVKSLLRNIKTIEAHPLFNKSATKEINMGAMKFDIESLKERNLELDNKLVGINEILDEVRVKVTDFNIYELFKDNKTESGTVDVSQVLIQALEQKVFKKLGFIDEKNRKNEYDILKNKNEVINMKAQLDGHTYSMNSLINDLTNGQKLNEKNQSEITVTLEELAKKSDSLKKKMKLMKEASQSDNQELKQITDALSKQVEEFDKKINDVSFNKEMFVTEQTYTKFKEIVLKKVHDIDQKFYEVNPIDRFRASEKRIQEIYDLVKDKPNQSDIFIINDRILTLTKRLDYAKESELNMIDMIDKSKKEMMFFNKKLESFQSTFSSIKNENPSTKGKKEIHIDMSKYLELATFNDYMKFYNKDKEKIRKEVEDLYIALNGLSGEMKLKASEYDMRRVEEFLLSSIEELKKSFNLKYVDKIEIAKTFKILEHQIRHIMELLTKKNVKGENWLLAKKPLGGHNCASCEAYIGDLNTSNEFITWNKIPCKEPVDALGYRTGNGFSRILSMVNLIQKPKKENLIQIDKDNSNFESDGEINHRKGSNTKSRMNKKISIESRTEENAFYYQGEASKEPYHDRGSSVDDPKMYNYYFYYLYSIKIFKKPKK